MENIFSYVGRSILWLVIAFGIPEIFYGIGVFLGTTFSPIFTNGLQIVALILSFSNMVKIISVILGWVDESS